MVALSQAKLAQSTISTHLKSISFEIFSGLYFGFKYSFDKNSKEGITSTLLYLYFPKKAEFVFSISEETILVFLQYTTGRLFLSLANLLSPFYL